MKDKIIAVPQQEFLDAIEMLEEYKRVCYHFIKEEVVIREEGGPLIEDLCEFYAGCARIKEMITKTMLKEVDSRGAKIPENTIAVDDLDYLTITELLIGILNLESNLLTQNVSLKKH